VVGGKHLLVGAVELERVLFADWAACLFYDAGNAFDRFADFRIAQAAGVGIRYFTPVGALTLYLARPLKEDQAGWRLHFSVGFEW
jgi:translocation and assembly module TamA